MKGRNAGIEVYRCLLMLGIVIIHATGHCVYKQAWGTQLFDWCVAGFVFISGFFGLKFKPSKCLSLIAIGVWCSTLAGLLSGANLRTAILGVNGVWFLWSYIVLMLLAPLIDEAVENCGKANLVKVLLPIFLLIQVWMFLLAVPIVRDLMPNPRGLQGLSFLSLIPIYISARIYRRFDLGRFISNRFIWITVPVCMALCLCGFWWYWWVPAILLSVVSFKVFSELKVPSMLGRLAVFAAPSMFSIYILHFSGGSQP